MRIFFDFPGIRIALLERQFLQQKAALWEVEERQISEKRELIKIQIEEIFIWEIKLADKKH